MRGLLSFLAFVFLPFSSFSNPTCKDVSLEEILSAGLTSQTSYNYFLSLKKDPAIERGAQKVLFEKRESCFDLVSEDGDKSICFIKGGGLEEVRDFQSVLVDTDEGSYIYPVILSTPLKKVFDEGVDLLEQVIVLSDVPLSFDDTSSCLNCFSLEKNSNPWEIRLAYRYEEKQMEERSSGDSLIQEEDFGAPRQKSSSEIDQLLEDGVQDEHTKKVQSGDSRINQELYAFSQGLDRRRQTHSIDDSSSGVIIGSKGSKFKGWKLSVDRIEGIFPEESKCSAFSPEN